MQEQRTPQGKRGETICPRCGQAFEHYLSQPRTYCSLSCSTKALNAKLRPPNLVDLVCEQCGQPFQANPTQTRGRFCSRKCWGAWSSLHVVGEAHHLKGRKVGRQPHWGAPIEKTCPVCQAVFRVRPSHAARRVCCSLHCLGVYFAESGRFTGANNPRWVGGYEPYYGPSWPAAQRATRARDQVCQRCGASPQDLGRALDVHHLRPFRFFGRDQHAEANALTNLVSLCKPCHAALEWETLHAEHV